MKMVVLLATFLSASNLLLADPPPKLVPGKTFTVEFPEMPLTYYALDRKQDAKTEMTVSLPTNYDPGRKHPLFIFLNGGVGAGGTGISSKLSEGKDFICVGVPLFKAPDSKPKEPGGIVILSQPDGKYMWPFFKTMMEKLEELVPNIAPKHRILGGFSNGAHGTAALIDGSDGEVTRRFSAFFFGEGGGKLQHYEWLKDKPFLMFSSNAKSRPRAQEICDAAKAAGAKATLVFHDVGAHDFPVAAYPAVREWLRGPALQ